ncbi:abscission/NoCut checkpoint regulator-like [Physella acuta]|uniref:abscission/NoCut checkpoint regulator-like n=1 Tax=Physella acuta TaxID=109671 RepID=UPI0027DD4092|nr:abscission/NoCut checkpoint regulator-like [Physella acuta]
MPGQCYGCGTEFTVFKKEHGCKNCGFAFCTKCLHDKTIPVPKRNNAKHHVCINCFKILTGAAPVSTGPTNMELPEAYLKRMAALKERESGTAVHSSGTSTAKVPDHLRRLDKADREIALRLEKLKETSQPKEPTSDAVLKERLAALKGQPVPADKKPVYQAPDRRCETQMVDDLLEQLTHEVEMDSRLPDPDQEIERRLRQLREKKGENPVPGKPSVEENNLDLSDKNGKATASNNLNTVDKMVPLVKPYSKNISAGEDGGETGAESSADAVEIQKLLSEVAKDLETDAQRGIEELQKDKALYDKLKEIQSKQEKQKHDPGKVTDSSAVSGDSDEENEDVAADKLIHRYLAEARLDETVEAPEEKQTKKKKTGKKEPKSLNIEPSPRKDNSDSDYDDSDELPYCSICTEDAVVRCRDCDLDLYCNRCFRECHAEFGVTHHRTVPYTAPKGYK